MGIEGGTAITVKSFASSVAALAVIGGGAAAGIASIAPPSGLAQMQLAAVGAPQQQDLPLAPNPPAQSLPTADQLTSLLTNLSDPGVSYTTKTGLVEGGISSGEGHLVDHELRKAYRAGELPLSFNVSTIQTTGPNAASADVAISGPKLPAPVTKNLTFINQSGWVLSHDSATQLVQAATSH
jgi:hypothetical protein